MILSEFTDTHDFTDVGESARGAFAGFFGALLHYAAQIIVVGENVVDAIADRSSHGENVLGELLFEVAIAYRAVGIGVAEVLDDVGCRRQLQERE